MSNELQNRQERIDLDLASHEIKGLTDPRVLRDCRVLYRIYPEVRGSVTREFGITALPFREQEITSQAQAEPHPAE